MSVIVFGSLARGEAGRDRYVDLVVIRPTDISEDDDKWAEALEAGRCGVARPPRTKPVSAAQVRACAAEPRPTVVPPLTTCSDPPTRTTGNHLSPNSPSPAPQCTRSGV